MLLDMSRQVLLALAIFVQVAGMVAAQAPAAPGAAERERVRLEEVARRQMERLDATGIDHATVVPESLRGTVFKISEVRQDAASGTARLEFYETPERLLEFGEKSWVLGEDTWVLGLASSGSTGDGMTVHLLQASTQIDGKRRFGSFLLRLDSEGAGDFAFNLQGPGRQPVAVGIQLRRSD
jgi:hypothetical protein